MLSFRYKMDQFEPDFIEDVKMGRPHVVILGAGASRACCPAGDKNGKKLPLMSDLIATVGLGDLLGGDSANKNIEELYSSHQEQKENEELINEIEKRIYAYFDSLEIPNETMLYDRLLLSLRGKDLIATFNWDPLLFFALQRNYGKADLPQVVYLHGNVALGYCNDCKIFGPKKGRCHCNKVYSERSRLLYPIAEKNYGEQDLLIKDAWNMLRQGLKNAYLLTIFGYSAPASDYEAMSIFKEAWGPSAQRELEQIEIITAPGYNEEEVSSRWDNLIHTHHYGIFDTFEHSEATLYPRRSCECLWSALMQCDPRKEHPIPNSTLPELWDWIRPLIEAEEKMPIKES